MSPICSKAAMRALISVLLASSVANAAALPHEVLDARAPAAIQNANAEIAAEAIQAAASAVAEDPDLDRGYCLAKKARNRSFRTWTDVA